VRVLSPKFDSVNRGCSRGRRGRVAGSNQPRQTGARREPMLTGTIVVQWTPFFEPRKAESKFSIRFARCYSLPGISGNAQPKPRSRLVMCGSSFLPAKVMFTRSVKSLRSRAQREIPLSRQRLVAIPGSFRCSPLFVPSLIAGKERSTILGLTPAADTRPHFPTVFGVQSAQIEAIPKSSVCFLGRINGIDLLRMTCFAC
jgi:hypothetical protein